MTTIDWPPARAPRRGGPLLVFAILAAIVLGGAATLSYYVESLWFGSLGFSEVFWTTLNAQGLVFLSFTTATFAILFGSFLLLKPKLSALAAPILINGQPLTLPVDPVLRLIAAAASILIGVVTGAGMMAQWTTFALYWHQPATTIVDPIFSRPIGFYLFTLPVLHLIVGWLTTVAVIVCAVAVFFAVVTGGARLLTRRTQPGTPVFRGAAVAFAALLFAAAAQVYLGRFDRILTDHPVFAGITYADANVTIPGMLLVAGALAAGGLLALAVAVAGLPVRWLVFSVAPAIVLYAGVSAVSWYVVGFVVKPNELVRERPYIAHNIAMTRQAFALDRITEVPFPADSGLEAVDPAGNQDTLQNIRLWDWRALQDTLRQIQEIRTYYDFPDIDIDRYEVDGRIRQMMLAVRELNVDRLPESSRTWINEKLVYTHGYGVTMNPVNGFTPDGLPALLLANMPVQSYTPSLKVTRPEIYFGELTNNDVYVKTRQQEFNYPQGETNSVTSYEGAGGLAIGGFFRRLLVALDRGDLTKIPFSDDVTAETRLLMRRNIRERAASIAPFLTFDIDPYIIVTDEGRLVWMIDAFTTSAAYPYARHYRIGDRSINYLRNSVKITIDAYDGTIAFYLFDSDDPVAAAYRSMFPSLFKDASAMPADVRRHTRYPELMLEAQAAVFGLYHMTSPDTFYNREDLWTVASEIASVDQRQQPQTMEPNFVLMKLPGEQSLEFIEILPFTPANRNNLIGWIAARSDDPHYGTAVVYNFPKNRLVDGPLQIEARIDQNAQLSGQLSLWNQQGSNVRRGNLVVIPVGRALLYTEAIYLQAERSPMPELRIVVLALQDRLAYGPNFESAMAALLGQAPSSLSPSAAANFTSAAPPPAATPDPAASVPAAGGSGDSLIRQAARDLEEYQRLTAEGKLGEAGQRLEALKQKLEQLSR